MASWLPDDAMAQPRARGRWEGHRRFDPRAMRNSVDATPLSYALYVVRDITLCDLLDPSRPIVAAIMAVDPDWTLCAQGAPGSCTLLVHVPCSHAFALDASVCSRERSVTRSC